MIHFRGMSRAYLWGVMVAVPRPPQAQAQPPAQPAAAAAPAPPDTEIYLAPMKMAILMSTSSNPVA